MCTTIQTKYLLADDMKIIENWAAELQHTSHASSVGISFRPAGEDTLRCLTRGAGAKPHEILDKTLKEKEGNEDHNKAVNEFFAGFIGASNATDKETAEDLFKGLVGHWNGGHVDGLYLTTIGYKTFGSNDQFTIQKNDKGKPYLVLKDAEQKNALIAEFTKIKNEQVKNGTESKAYYLFTRLFFSGDYDIHDFVIDKRVVLTSHDTQYLRPLQDALIAARKEQLTRDYHLIPDDFKGEEPKDYQRVQHGPQYNYTTQMLNDNKKIIVDKQSTDVDQINILVESVMDMDLPVAFYDKDYFEYGWEILSTADSVSQYYSTNNIPIKESWRSAEKREEFIKRNIRNIAIICFPKLGDRLDVTPEKLLEKAPQLKQVYGEKKYKKYAEAALKEI